MTLQDLVFPTSFFEDEVREGFFIPTMMKRNWACQLEILKVIDTICKRHEIQWFIDSGTLLGAVRHQGFIPWDDDIDIIMKRSDQKRFIEVAEQELPDGYILRNTEKDNQASNSNLMLFNSDTIETSAERMERFHGFPYGVCVDIFTLDGVADDPAEHEKIHQRIDSIRDAITLLKENQKGSSEFRSLLREIERDNGVVLGSSKHLESDLWHLMSKHHMTVSDLGASKYEFFWGKNDRLIYEAEAYAEAAMLPFEFLSLPAPVGYLQVLRTVFGNYEIPKRIGGAHPYPVYGGQERKLAADMGCNPFRYTMTRDNVSAVRSKSPVVQAQEMFTVMEKVAATLRGIGTDAAAATKLLLAMQNLTTKLMELLVPIFAPISERQPSVTGREAHDETCDRMTEGEVGKKENAAISHLQNLSATIFSAFQEWKPEMAGKLSENIREVRKTIVSEYDARQEILVLLTRSKWWPSMEPLLERFQNEPSHTEQPHFVFIKTPLYRKSFSTDQGEPINTADVFPETVCLTETTKYDIAARHPSKIIMQFPFDSTDTALTTDEMFFSSHLKNATDELIYIPCFDAESPEQDDVSLKTTLRTLIEQPAVAFADCVMVRDEKMRLYFIEVLKSIVGSDTAEIWEEKIRVRG